MLRREFILGMTSTALGTPAFASLSDVASTNQAAITRQFDVAPAKHRLGDANASDSDLWLYGNSSPGPLIRAKQHDRLSVTFNNRLPVGTSVHWHGIRIDNRMDGVAHLTQQPIASGESFTYDFTLPDAGTYWFHSHTRSWEQLAKGLYGPLIVDGPDDPEVDHDIVWMIDDWRVDENWQIDSKSFGSLRDWSHQGRLGNWLTVNSISDLTEQVKPNSRIRLRLINAANARIFNLSFSGKTTLIATDGFPTSHQETDRITLAPAQRVDLIVDVGTSPLSMTEISGGTLPAGKLLPSNSLGNASAAGSKLVQPTLPDVPEMTKARRIAVHMQGGVHGNLESAEFEGEVLGLRDLATKHNKLWAFNGKVGSHSLWLTEAERGTLISLDVFNDTGWPHAMHLHGHHFWVLSPDGAPLHAGKRDTHLMQPGERASLVFVADNPGLWLFHCHMMEHHAAGMGAVVAVL